MIESLLDDAPIIVPGTSRTSVTREEALEGSPEQKQHYFLDVKIEVDGFTQASKFVDALLDRGKRRLKPGGLWVIGEGGVGKSFILDDIYKRYPHLDTSIARLTPLICLSFRSRPSASDLLCTMLFQLGQDPGLMKNKSNDDLEDSLIESLKSCGTLGIMFDEAHHLWLNSSGRIKDRVGGPIGDLLKRMYDRTNIAYIFSGTPGLISTVFVDKQVRTRWAGVITLKEFELDARFYGLLNALDSAIPLPKESGLGQRRKLAESIYASTLGNFRLIKDLLGEAVFLAAKDNSSKLEVHHLAEAHFRLFCDREYPFV